ncbi:hypothetical protein Q3H59_004141 [Pantoea sp. SORGH_AS 659]|nr:hypothetical protein [Pantoea sp. SORGH_AS_0659]
MYFRRCFTLICPNTCWCRKVPEVTVYLNLFEDERQSMAFNFQWNTGARYRLPKR